MTPPPCNRVRDALAAHNVWGDAALLEHAKDCEICTTELAALKKRRDFRDAFPVLSSIADEGATGKSRASAPTETRGSRRHLLVMIATLVAIFGYLTRSGPFKKATVEKTSDADTSNAPHYKIYNLDNALFESKVEGTTVRASMSRGLASFHVDPLNAEQRFLLTLPDGELEVRGTSFVVSIANGKTQQIDVNAGAVALKLQGKDEIVLSAGQRWPSATGKPSVSFMNFPRKDAGAPAPAASSE
ncbi:MAG: hypothetical protein ABW133_16150 [Polyangiaceae bacterium]